ncbi:20193_t:CDS:2, partial [Cetraspora pellucida]
MPISISEQQEVLDVIPQVTLEHLTSIRQSCKTTTNLIKARYAKLFRLSKKIVNLALKADLGNELSDILNNFLYETQNKGHSSKRLKLIAEETSSKSKCQLKDNMLLNIINKNLETGSNIKEV